jgi:Halocarboxylic acid dehydrogenase DehI
MPWRKGNRLRLVSETEARGRTREIYDDVRTTLGLPITPTSFQAFATIPAFLELVWSALRPLVRTQQFFVLAERLSADAYTRCYTYFPVPDLQARLERQDFTKGAREEIASSIEMLDHGSGIILLLLAVLLQSFEGPVGQERESEGPAVRPVYEVKPPLVSDETASPEVRRIFEDARKILKSPHLTAELRTLARWPEFFTEYWQGLKKCLESPLYEVCFRGVHETAFTLTREIPVMVELTTEQLTPARLSQDEIASVLHLTDSFVMATVGTVLNISFAKIAMEGGNKVETHAPEQVA